MMAGCNIADEPGRTYYPDYHHAAQLPVTGREHQPQR